MRISKLESERGMAALVALLLVGMLTIIGLAALSTSNDEVQVAGNQLQETQAFYAAESMGVRLMETKPEIRIATMMVAANS